MAAEIISREVSFQDMIEKRTYILTMFGDIDKKIKQLYDIHNTINKTHNDEIYKFGLDSFHFQTKLIKLDLTHLKGVFCVIDNRIYCEYFKLYNIIALYIGSDAELCSNITTTFIDKKFPTYKDLEPNKVYDIGITSDIYTTIQGIINDMSQYLNDKRSKLEAIENSHVRRGMNVNGLIIEGNYKIRILDEKIKGFKQYVETFNIHHIKYLDELSTKTEMTNNMMNDNIVLGTESPKDFSNGMVDMDN